jgi:hypothetical protein
MVDRSAIESADACIIGCVRRSRDSAPGPLGLVPTPGEPPSRLLDRPWQVTFCSSGRVGVSMMRTAGEVDSRYARIPRR